MNDGTTREAWEAFVAREKVQRRNGNGHGWTLAAGVTMWAAPTTRDWKDGARPSKKVPTNGLLGRQAPRSGIGGPELTQDSIRQWQTPKLRLNPLFVEWLMGFPVGWTDSKPLGMPSYRTWLRSRGERS
jgi:DNA (cytosine-5)-methyltransferase 1